MATSKMVKTESEMTPSERAQLTAQRVRDREKAAAEKKKEQEKPTVLDRLRNMVSPRKTSGDKKNVRDSLSKEDMMADIEEEKQMKKAEAAAKDLSVTGFKKGGMVTARGQGRVRTKKATRIC